MDESKLSAEEKATLLGASLQTAALTIGAALPAIPEHRPKAVVNLALAIYRELLTRSV